MFLSKFGCFYGSTLHKDQPTNHITEIKYFLEKNQNLYGSIMFKVKSEYGNNTLFDTNWKLYGSIMFKVESEYGNNTLFGNNWKLYGSTVSKDLPTNQIRVLYDINVDENLPTKKTYFRIK